MVGTIARAIAKAQTCENQTILNLNFKKFGFQMFLVFKCSVFRSPLYTHKKVKCLSQTCQSLISAKHIVSLLQESQLAAEQKAKLELAGGRSQFELQIRQLEDQLGMERKMSVTNQVPFNLFLQGSDSIQLFFTNVNYKNPGLNYGEKIPTGTKKPKKLI